MLHRNRGKQVYLVLSKETRLALKMLSAVYDLGMSETATKLIMKAYSEQEFDLPKEKMSKIRRLFKRWA